MAKRYYYLKCSDCKERICHANEKLSTVGSCTMEEIAYNTLDLFDNDAWKREKRKNERYSERGYSGQKLVFADESSVPERKPLLAKHYRVKSTVVVPQPWGGSREFADHEKHVVLLHSPITGNVICMDGIRRPDEYVYYEIDVDGPDERDVRRKFDVALCYIEDGAKVLSSPLSFAEDATLWQRFKARMPPFLRTKRFLRYLGRKWYEYVWRGREDEYESRFMDAYEKMKEHEENEEYVRNIAARQAAHAILRPQADARRPARRMTRREYETKAREARQRRLAAERRRTRQAAPNDAFFEVVEEPPRRPVRPRQ